MSKIQTEKEKGTIRTLTTDANMPRTYISYPISSPAALSALREHVMFIGAGVGIATFLGFLDRTFIEMTEGIDHSGSQSPRKERPTSKKTDLVFISRELEHMKWMAKYIDAILRIPEITNKIRFHIYITITPESNNLANFLFWRSLILYNRKLERLKNRENGLIINLGRPNFVKLINEVCVENTINTHYVYACGPTALTSSLEKIIDRTVSQNKHKKIVFNYEIF